MLTKPFPHLVSAGGFLVVVGESLETFFFVDHLPCPRDKLSHDVLARKRFLEIQWDALRERFGLLIVFFLAYVKYVATISRRCSEKREKFAIWRIDREHILLDQHADAAYFGLDLGGIGVAVAVSHLSPGGSRALRIAFN